MLHNLSPWQASLTENWQQNKQKCLTLVVKQSFEFDDNGQVFLMETGDDIVMADEMLADPIKSSLKNTNETAAFKAGFELYGNLTAYPPKGKQAKVIEVNVTLKQQESIVFSKTLRVTGERIWQSSLLGNTTSSPQPLAATPLNYENTYGGIDAQNSKKIYEENPAGKGFRVKQTKGSALPCVEYPHKFLKHPKKTIPPASYGAIPSFWQPRLALIPNIDEELLMAGEYPYKGTLPSNCFNCAPKDQQVNITFDQSCTLCFKGVSPNKAYQHITELTLPYQPPEVVLIKDEQQKFIELTCDTLVLDADANAFHLLWRTSVAKSEVNEYSQWIVQQNKAVQQQGETS